MANRPPPSYLRASVPALAVAAVMAITSPATAACPATRHFTGPLQDLQPATVDATDGATAALSMRALPGGHGTRFVLRVRHADPAAVGTTLGAHLHTGPCVAGDGAAAGPHYNVSTQEPPVASPAVEVWLDLTLDRHGRGRSLAVVPFVPEPGARSVVLHAMPTDPSGAAGTRLACLPVVWS